MINFILGFLSGALAGIITLCFCQVNNEIKNKEGDKNK